MHVNDLVQAHLLALERLMIDGRSDIYNIGNSRGYSVKEVIETIEHVTGLSLPVVETRRRPGDPAELVADATQNQSETRLASPIRKPGEHRSNCLAMASQEVRP